MKEHDRLVLARTLLERKLEGRRTSSKLPELVELVMAKPLVSAGMVAKNARRHASGGAADRGGAGPQGDDGEGEVSGVGCDLGETSKCEGSSDFLSLTLLVMSGGSSSS